MFLENFEVFRCPECGQKFNDPRGHRCPKWKPTPAQEPTSGSVSPEELEEVRHQTRFF